MADKISLTSILSGFNLANINSNFQKIEDYINDKVLSRDINTGESNSMQDTLDMNSNTIINLPTPVSPSSAATKAYVDGLTNASGEYITTLVETFTGTEGQTVFTASNAYVPGADNITVYVNGVYQDPSRYAETSSTVITLSEGVDAGDSVTLIINQRAVSVDYSPVAGDVEFVHVRSTDAGLTLANGQGSLSSEGAAQGVSLRGKGSTNDLTLTDQNSVVAAKVKSASNGVFTASSLEVENDVTGTVNFSDLTDATSADDASVTLDGGLGVAKKIFAADDIVMGDGKGIDFSNKASSLLTGTSSSGFVRANAAEANTLKHYEEGTWTPQIYAGSNLATQSVSEGRYVKVGRMVYLYARIEITSLGSMSGLWDIDGIPYTQSGLGTDPFMDCCGHILFALNTNLAPGDFFIGEVRNGSSHVNIGIYDGSTGNIAPVDTSMLSATTEIGFSIMYEAVE